jgi:putative addiction module component (TIGR02574 family)
MGKPLSVPPGFDDLPVEEQIQFLGSLWDRIAATPDRVPVPSWHLKLIDQRRDDLEANPDDAVSWGEIRDELNGKLQSKR